MHRFVREIEKPGLAILTLGEPVERVLGQFIGNVAALPDALSIHIESVGAGEVRALPAEADPAVEAGLRLVPAVSHVPLSEVEWLCCCRRSCVDACIFRSGWRLGWESTA